MSAPESVMEQIRKIQALAESGINGERENAQAILARLCSKHAITAEQLLEQEEVAVRLGYSGELEHGILANVVFYAIGRRDVVMRAGKSFYDLFVTRAEAIDVVACWKHYRAEWRSELALFKSAFIHKHKIFGPPATEASPKPFDIQRAERLLAMMRGVGGRTWIKPVAQLTAGGVG